MSQWQQQIAANAAAIQQIINNAKEINQHDPLATALQADDSLLIQIEATGATVHLTLTELAAAVAIINGGAGSSGWVWSNTEDCEIKKADGNGNLDLIEDGDWVRNKSIEGDTVMLTVAVYDESADGGDKDSEDSYTIPWTILT